MKVRILLPALLDKCPVVWYITKRWLMSKTPNPYMDGEPVANIWLRFHRGEAWTDKWWYKLWCGFWFDWRDCRQREKERRESYGQMAENEVLAIRAHHAQLEYERKYGTAHMHPEE